MTTVNVTLTKPQADLICKTLRGKLEYIRQAHKDLTGFEIIDGTAADKIFAPERRETIGALQAIRKAVAAAVESCVETTAGGDE